MSSISGSCRLPIPRTASRARSGGKVRRNSTPRSATASAQLSTGRSTASSIRGGSRLTARAFAGDGKALETAQLALARFYPTAFNLTMRLFFYMPFQHSEALVDQELGCALFAAFEDEETIKHAVEHRDVIQRFGRFPHRNDALGRVCTPDELDYLKTG